jgi:hypothetical protein
MRHGIRPIIFFIYIDSEKVHDTIYSVVVTSLLFFLSTNDKGIDAQGNLENTKDFKSQR